MSTATETTAGRSRIGEADRETGIGAPSSPAPEVHGRPRDQDGWTGAGDGAGLATFLGWFSVGLGTMQLVAPGNLTRLIGLRPTGTRSMVMRAMGLREIAHGAGILSNPTSRAWVGSRVGGDVLDLALLGVALAKSERPGRTLLATAAVLGAGALDVLGTKRLA